MTKGFKLKGLLIDVNNVIVQTVEIEYHPETGYKDFEILLGSSWLSSCKRPIPFMDDVRIIHDDNGLLKEHIKPGYILHKNDEILSLIPGNIFICEEVVGADGNYEFASLTENEIRIIKEHIVEIEENGVRKISLVISADSQGLLYKY